MIVIDLGLERGEPPSYADRRTPTPSWIPVSLLALLLLLTAGASVSPAASPFTSLVTLAMNPGDAYALAGDGELLAQTYGELVAYGLQDGKLRWTNGPLAPAFQLATGGGTVLFRPSVPASASTVTTAVDLLTGADLWSRAGQIVTVAGSETLLAVNVIRMIGETDQHIVGDVSAVDPVTGSTLWTVGVPGTAALIGLPGPGDSTGRMLLVRGDGTAVIDDLATGHELARATIPAVDFDPGNPLVTGSAILLLHDGLLSAYDPQTLRPLWTRPAPGTEAMSACGALACLTGVRGGVTALDPVTGAGVWSHADWGLVQRTGTTYVAYADGGAEQALGVIDPASGRILVDLRGWRPVDGSSGNGGLFVTRDASAGVDTQGAGRTMIAVAQPGVATPQPLDVLPTTAGDCLAAPGRLVCRTGYGELTVWAYGRKG